MTSLAFKFKLCSCVRFQNVVGREDYNDFDGCLARVCVPLPSSLNGMTYAINILSEDGKNELDALIKVPGSCLQFACCKCFKHISTTQLCGKCRIANYCGRDCQLADWREHKEMCTKSYSHFYTASKSPLYLPALTGDLNRIRLLVDSGAAVNKTDNVSGQTALISACESGRLKVAEYLIGHGADINHYDKKGRTALDYACSRNDADIVDYLLNQGAKIEKSRNDGGTALGVACHNGSLAVVKLLIKRSVDVNNSGRCGWTPLMCAAAGGNVDIVRCLVEAGAELETADDSGATALVYASQYGHVGIVIFLLQHGTDMEQIDIYGNSPLIVASVNGHLDVVRVLVQKGANKDLMCPTKGTALFQAVVKGNLSVVQYLVQKGADVNIRDPIDNFSPLEASITSPLTGQEEILECLLEHGAKTTINLVNGSTPLKVAIHFGKLNLVKILLRHGVDLFIVRGGITPVAYAKELGHDDIATFLLGKGVV